MRSTTRARLALCSRVASGLLLERNEAMEKIKREIRAETLRLINRGGSFSQSVGKA